MFFLLSALACFFEKTDNFNTSHCDEKLEKIHTTDEFDGFSWQHWLDRNGENGLISGDVEVFWKDSGLDCLTWQFIPNQDTAHYVSAEIILPEAASPTELHSTCMDSIEISGSLSLQSGDGRINETISVTMKHYFEDSIETKAQISFFLEASEWQGTLRPISFEKNTSFDSQSFYIALDLDEAEISGNLSLQTEGTTEDKIWTTYTSVANFEGECSEITE